MRQRRLGKTGLEVSMLGLGGFHLLEIPTPEAVSLIDYYLDSGGNYLETAASYGDGESEVKLGKVIRRRRDACILATKTGARDAGGAAKSLERSLRNLNTDHIDILFMHSVSSIEDLDRILGPGGAMEFVERARRNGKVRYVAISVHGQPGSLITALRRYPFDAAMATLNYYDRCNFPELETELIPLCREKDTGLLAMKAMADGFLWRSVPAALRYVWSLDRLATIVAGANSRAMLEQDIQCANEFQPMSGEEVAELFRHAPELGNYVCRQCATCPVCNLCGRVPVKDVFRLEGYFDRQMRDGDPRTPPEFALRDRLRFWYENRNLARAEYGRLGIDASKICGDCRKCDGKCPYGLPVRFKLRHAHYKLSGDAESF